MTDVTELPPPPGTELEEPAPVDFYGGIDATEKFYFPGQNEQYIEFSLMDEGMRKKWQRDTRSGIKVDRKTQSAEIGLDPARDRESLLRTTVVNWFIRDPKRGNQPVAFTEREFGAWMNRTSPLLIDKLELAIRDANPWMQDEMDPDSIQEEIDRLTKLRDEAIARRESKS